MNKPLALDVPEPATTDLLKKEEAIKLITVAINRFTSLKLTIEIQLRFYKQGLKEKKMEVLDNRGKPEQKNSLIGKQVFESNIKPLEYQIEQIDSQVLLAKSLIKDIEKGDYKI